MSLNEATTESVELFKYLESVKIEVELPYKEYISKGSVQEEEEDREIYTLKYENNTNNYFKYTLWILGITPIIYYYYCLLI